MTSDKTIHWIFRIAIALEFIGHGAFGVETKSGWLPFFTLFGIDQTQAYLLMPVIGFIDIFIGLTILIRPMRGPLLYAAVWGLWTALLRPLAGFGLLEFLERTYNFAIPALFYIKLFHSYKLSDEKILALLKVTLSVSLIAHAGLLVIHPLQPLNQIVPAPVLSLIEISIAGFLLVSARPAAFLLAGFLKLGIESIWLMTPAQSPHWEVIERASCYATFFLVVAYLMHGRRNAPQYHQSQVRDRVNLPRVIQSK